MLRKKILGKCLRPPDPADFFVEAETEDNRPCGLETAIDQTFNGGTAITCQCFYK